MEQDKKSGIVVSVRPVQIETTSDDGNKFSSQKDADVESQLSSVGSLEKGKSGKISQKWFKCSGSGPWARLRRNLQLDRNDDISAVQSRRRRWCKWVLIVIVVLSFFGIVAAIIYVSFVRTLIGRLAPRPGHSGLDAIVKSWKEPDANGAFKYQWRDDFSRDIVPKNCHSHNDYWRSVPLYAALAAGCTSFEADVWLTDDNDLRVGHTLSATTQYRTLRNLYLDPLTNIFEKRNVSTASNSDREIGMFDAEPNTSAVLLIDVKTDGHRIWPVLQSQLQSLRDRNWLTYYDGKTLHEGPLTIVGSGQTPFELIQRNTTERWIFYDAPLVSISQPQFDSTNSYYASTNLKAAISYLWLGKFSAKQEKLVKQQIEAAEVKGLKSRYYGTPAWPISLRDSVWVKLMELGVGVLNVDDLTSATRWNWGFCVVAGFVLCGNS